MIYDVIDRCHYCLRRFYCCLCHEEFNHNKSSTMDFLLPICLHTNEQYIGREL